MVVFSTEKAVDLIKSQFYKDSFLTFDTIVRLLAIEIYYGINDFGMNLQIKMQQEKGSYEDYNGECFRQLMQPWKKKRSDVSYNISQR